MTFLDEMVESRKCGVLDVRIACKQFLEERYYADRTRLSEVLKKRDRIGVIAELKVKSPLTEQVAGQINGKSPESASCMEYHDSHNILEPTLENISEIANEMLSGGACAISVITEPKYFSGSYGNLQQITQVVPKDVPVILKDFIIDSSQIELGVFCGASNGLIIPKICDPINTAKIMVKYGLEPLIEIHDMSDLEAIEPLKDTKMTFVIAINNWDLTSFAMDFKTSFRLVPEIRKIFGPRQLIITEGGINTRQDIIEIGRTRIRAALVGTSIMGYTGPSNVGSIPGSISGSIPGSVPGSISSKLSELLGFKKPFIKICGITDESIFNSIPTPVSNSTSIPTLNSEPNTTPNPIPNTTPNTETNAPSNATNNAVSSVLNWQSINAFGVILGDPLTNNTIPIEKVKLIFENSPLFLQRTIVVKNKTLSEIFKYNEILNPDLIQCNLKEMEKNPRAVPRKLAMKIIHTISLSDTGWEGAVKIIKSIPKYIFGIALDISPKNGIMVDIEQIVKVVQTYPQHRMILTGEMPSISLQNLIDIYIQSNGFGLDIPLSKITQDISMDLAKISDLMQNRNELA